MSGRILAIDSGLTVTKAVIFDLDGRQRGSAASRGAICRR
jgi:sugar (pentulose or hexulose) kinase